MYKRQHVEIVDLREEFKKKNFSIFSERLNHLLHKTLDYRKQTILFLNRRGSDSAVVCRECGFTMLCDHCDVPLTHHWDQKTKTHLLLCHHCNFTTIPPHICPRCQGSYIKFLGIGTQRIEQEVKKHFPHAKTIRIDRDTTTKKYSLQKYYQTFKTGQADILIGTQMITKGLDLDNVETVGVILADVGLHIPDFRSAEHVFSLITQVAGRAGRRGKIGNVIVQTYTPEHYSIRSAAKQDFKSFYDLEIEYRKELNNPPFANIIKLTYSHPSLEKAREQSRHMYDVLKFKNLKLGLQISYAPALIQKLHDKYRYNILIKGKNPHQLLKELPINPDWRIDVDPEYCV